MTQAPDRARVPERDVAPATPPPARPSGHPPRDPPRDPPREPPRDPPVRAERFDKAAWSRAVLVVNLALVGCVAVWGITHLGDDRAPGADARPDRPSPTASTLVVPDDPAPGSPPRQADDRVDERADDRVDERAGETQPPPPRGAQAAPPRVRSTMRTDFAAGDDWPFGAGFREVGSLAWPLGVVDRVMTHGPAQGPDAVSWLERWLRTDVRTIGARVRFAARDSGRAAMTAWHTSVLERTGRRIPRTGMRLTMAPGRWRLVAIDRDGYTTLAGGSWVQRGRSATFTLVREGRTVWVTAPDGAVTEVADPRVAALAGPWASWELREDRPGLRPAALQAIWAG